MRLARMGAVAIAGVLGSMAVGCGDEPDVKSTSKPTPQPPAVAELARYQGVLWSLSVEVGGSARRFLIDLGAGVTSLDDRLAEELGLRELRRVTGTRMTGEKLEI